MCVRENVKIVFLLHKNASKQIFYWNFRRQRTDYKSDACDQIWQKIATLVNLKVLGNIFEAWFTICLHFKPILAIFMIGIGQIIITVVISQILKNDLDIWSHWSDVKWCGEFEPRAHWQWLKKRIRTYFVRESVTVRLTSSITGLDSVALLTLNNQQIN